MKKIALVIFIFVLSKSYAQNTELTNAILNLKKFNLEKIENTKEPIINNWVNFYKKGEKLDTLNIRGNKNEKYNNLLKIYLGDYFSNKKQDSIAFKHYLLANKKALKNQDTLLINISLIKLCEIQFKLRNNRLLKQYLKIFDKYKKDETDLFYYHYYKIVDKINDNIDFNTTELPSFKKAELYAENNHYLKGVLFNTMGLCYDIFTTNFEYAIINYRKSIANYQYYDSFQTDLHIEGIEMNIAISNFKLENYNEAIITFEKLLLNLKNNNLYKKQSLNRWLYKCYNKQKNFEKAIKHIKNATKINEELAYTKHAKDVIFFDNKLKLENKQKQLEKSLNKNKKLHSKMNTILPILAVITLLLGVVFILYKKYYKKTEHLEIEKFETIKKINELKQIVVKNHIVLKDKTKVYIADLLYIKSDGHYLEVYLSNGKNHLVRGKLNKIIEELPPNFIRSHRSFVVNRNFVKQINNTNIILVDKTEIPLSRTYKERF